MSGTFSAGDLGLGKTVTGSDGKKVGIVNEVVEDPSASPDSSARFYFEVNCGGFLGIGASHLYIPVEAVASAHRGQDVVLLDTAQEAGEKYTHRPDRYEGGTQT